MIISKIFKEYLGTSYWRAGSMDGALDEGHFRSRYLQSPKN
jgi:hypothetical protein